MVLVTEKLRPGGKIAKALSVLRHDILTGRHPAGASLPSQEVLCRKHGLSESSARAVMTRLAQEGLVRRVPGQGSFVCEKLPTAKRTIDFVRLVEEPGERKRLSTLATIDAFVQTCVNRDIHPVWHYFLLQEMLDPENLADRLLHSRGVIALTAPPEFARLLHRRGVPVLAFVPQALGSHLRPELYPQITYDRRAMARGAVEYLARLGYRRIGFVGRHRLTERSCGFLDGMRASKLDVNLNWMVDSLDDHARDVQPWIKDLCAGEDRPQALCCATDYVAACIETMLLDLGVRIPEDIALVAGDDGPDAAQAPVPITAYGVDRLEQARIALDALDRHHPDSAGASGTPVEAIFLPLKLMVRESCGEKQKNAIASK